MKKLLLALALIPVLCTAKTITGITANVDVASVQLNAEIRFTIMLEVPESADPWCGLLVDFGDGNSARAPIRDKAEVPFVTTHRYTVPGNFVVKAEGALLKRGLRTVPPCGRSRTLGVRVVDPEVSKEAERLKQNVGERDRALLQAQDERDRALGQAQEERDRALRHAQERDRALLQAQERDRALGQAQEERDRALREAEEERGRSKAKVVAVPPPPPSVREFVAAPTVREKADPQKKSAPPTLKPKPVPKASERKPQERIEELQRAF